MSYDSDYESVYMVEFVSGKTIHVQFFDVEEVKEYCADNHAGEIIKTIYAEVYVNAGAEPAYSFGEDWE
jgi:hypothetical protein